MSAPLLSKAIHEFAFECSARGIDALNTDEKVKQLIKKGQLQIRGEVDFSYNPISAKERAEMQLAKEEKAKKEANTNE